jgi:RNA polymerase sigma-70 factor (ECF subfamily)
MATNLAHDAGRGGTAMQAADDRQLIERIASQDQTALRVLFARHQVRVFRFIVRMTRNEAVAEELTNEVFLEVWRHARNYEGRASALTWVLSIAHNRTVSTLRKRRDEALDEDAASEIEDPDDDPEVTAQKTDKSAVMRRCMEQLTADHLEIIDLVYYQEMSISEASAIIGIPENTVKTRMFYARKRLSELLKAAGVDRGWP